MNITSIFNFLFSKLSEFFNKLDTLYIFPNISLLKFSLGFIILTVIIQVLTSINVDGGLYFYKNQYHKKNKLEENRKEKNLQKKGKYYIFILLALFPIKVQAQTYEVQMKVVNGTFYTYDTYDLDFLQNYITDIYNGNITLNGNKVNFKYVFKATANGSTYYLCNNIYFDFTYFSDTKIVNSNSCVATFSYNASTNTLTQSLSTTNLNQIIKPFITINGVLDTKIGLPVFFWSDGSVDNIVFDEGIYLDIKSDFLNFCPYGSDDLFTDNMTHTEFFLYRYYGYYIYSNIDTISPALTLIGSLNYNHEINTIYNDLGYTCQDDSGVCDVEIIGEVDTSILGQYDIEYKACDSSNNCTSKFRTVNIIDTIPPVLNLSGDIELSIYKDTDFSYYSYNVSDNSNEDIEVEIIGEVDTSILGQYEIEYKACDSSNNCTSKFVIVNVIEKPSLNLTGKQFLFIDFDDISQIFPDLDITNLSNSEQLFLIFLINIFILLFISFVLFIVYKIIFRLKSIILG